MASSDPDPNGPQPPEPPDTGGLSNAVPAALEEIVAHKRQEVEHAKARVPLELLKERISELGRPRNFFKAVVRHKGATDVSVIAEIKRKSPSAGWIRPEYQRDDFDPTSIARRYHAGGAAAISCLTDEKYFAGRLEYIHRVKDAVPLPVLRKDFIIDEYQVWESRAAGADAVLLIAECLTKSGMLDLMILARELQLTTLVEVHSFENLLRVRDHVGFPDRSYGLLGINNRDLSTMRTSLGHTLRMAEMAEDTRVLVSESGITTPEDLRRLGQVGVRIVLVGEHLMRQDDPGAALQALLGSA